EAAFAASQTISELVTAIKTSTENPKDPAAQKGIIDASKNFAHPAANLVAVAKRSVPKVSDLREKASLSSASEEVAQALKKLMLAIKAAAQEGPTKEVTEALDQLNFVNAELDAAAIAAEAG